jgi:anti-sigma factor RsiW
MKTTGRDVTCRDGVAVLADYVDGALPAGRRRALDAHVAGCRRCQRFVKSYLATPRLVREATGERMPDALRRRLRDRLRAR